MRGNQVQTQIAELQQQNRMLTDRLKRLEDLLATADQRLAPVVSHGGHSGEASEPASTETYSPTGAGWSRRALLFGGVSAAAGGLAHLTATAGPAAAASGDPILAGQNNSAGTSSTRLTASATNVFSVYNDRSSATAVHAEMRSGSGTAVRGVCLNGIGIAGESARGIAVKGTSDSNAGVSGTSNSGPAVQARADTGFGLSAESTRSTAIYGVTTSASPAALLISGLGPALRLSPGLLESRPTFGAWATGDFVVARNDEIWLHSGGWRLLASPQSTGAYVPITPARVYDSRKPQPDAGAILVGGTQRVIDVGVARDPATGAPQSRVVPLGTRAVSVNITITGTTRSGYVALTPAAARTATSSAINWTSPQTTLANGLVLTTDAQAQLKAWVVGGNTHLIIDVMGYFGEA